MRESRYGNTILLVGGIQLLVVFAVWIRTLTKPPLESSWVSTLFEMATFWLTLVGGGFLLIRLDFLLRSGWLQFTDEAESPGAGRLLFEAYTIALITILGAIFIAFILYY